MAKRYSVKILLFLLFIPAVGRSSALDFIPSVPAYEALVKKRAELFKMEGDLEKKRKELATLNGQLKNLQGEKETRRGELKTFSRTKEQTSKTEETVDRKIQSSQDRLGEFEERQKSLAGERELLYFHWYGLFKMKGGAERSLVYLKYLLQTTQSEALKLEEEVARVRDDVHLSLQEQQNFYSKLEELKKKETDLEHQDRALTAQIEALNAKRKEIVSAINSSTTQTKKIKESYLQEEKAIKESSSFYRLKGMLPFPVSGRKIGGGVHHALSLKGMLIEPTDAMVRSVAEGKIVFVGERYPYGKMVTIDQGQGYFLLLGMLDQWKVESGERVSKGARLGVAGKHLYVELRFYDDILNPEEWFRID